jgi:hypothetical protein
MSTYEETEVSIEWDTISTPSGIIPWSEATEKQRRAFADELRQVARDGKLYVKDRHGNTCRVKAVLGFPVRETSLWRRMIQWIKDRSPRNEGP